MRKSPLSILKGNLAHKFAGPYFLCFLFDLDVFNTLKEKILDIIVNLEATEVRRSS